MSSNHCQMFALVDSLYTEESGFLSTSQLLALQASIDIDFPHNSDDSEFDWSEPRKQVASIVPPEPDDAADPTLLLPPAAMELLLLLLPLPLLLLLAASVAKVTSGFTTTGRTICVSDGNFRGTAVQYRLISSATVTFRFSGASLMTSTSTSIGRSVTTSMA